MVQLRDVKRGLYISEKGIVIDVVGYYRHATTKENGILFMDYLTVQTFEFVYAETEEWFNLKGFRPVDPKKDISEEKRRVMAAQPLRRSPIRSEAPPKKAPAKKRVTKK